VPARSGGIFVIEVPGASAEAPIDPARVRAWIERVPTLLLDGARPTPSELAARLASFWVPGQQVVFIGHTDRSVGGRVAALQATPLGDRRPSPTGHWLKTLATLERSRVWWAVTDAVEEYVDGVLGAFVDAVGETDRVPPGPLLPFANLETATGERRPHGLTGFLRVDSAEETAAAARAAASGSGRAAGGAPGRAPTRAASATARPAAKRVTKPRATSTRARPEPTYLSASGLAALRAELEELRTVRRPEVIERVKTARELGDLRENADYEAARNEQSFLEGRIQAVEQMLASAVIIDQDATVGGVIVLGSTVVVAANGERDTYVLVGSHEADPVAGRISGVSPVGRALLGRAAGDTVEVTLPKGTVTYRIEEVR
jgi:transcription elongation factor GreA